MNLESFKNSLSILSNVLPNYNEMKNKINIINDIPLMISGYNQTENFPIFEFEEVISNKNKKKEEVKVTKSAAVIKKEENNKIVKKTSTIDHSINYTIVTEYNRQNLEKLKLDNYIDITPDIFENYGTLHYIDTEYLKINTLNSVPIKISDDIRFYSNASVEKDKNLELINNINVFASDKVISTIMAMYLNSRPWHINVKKVGDKLYFDLDENSGLYYSTISESEQLADDEDVNNINNEFNLSKEGYLINQYLRQQVLGNQIEEEFLKNFNPFPFNYESSDMTERQYNKKTFTYENIIKPNLKDLKDENICFSYRGWNVGNLKILVRCQIHAAIGVESNEEEDNYFKYENVNIYALNEFNVSFIYILKETTI